MNRSTKLLSLNVSIFDENNEKLEAFIRQIHPDILCLQEVTKKVDSSARDSYISKPAIDRATPDLPYSFYAQNWALRDFRMKHFHGKDLFTHDFGGIIEYGNYTRSKFPVVYGKSVFLQGHFSYITDWDFVAAHHSDEPRMVAVVDLSIDDKPLRIINYHGIWSKEKHDLTQTIAASKKLLDVAGEVEYPVILAGDFNLFPETKSIRMLSKKFTNLVDKFHIMRTRPLTNELSHEKRNVVDYIFVTKDIRIKNFSVIESDVSDHLPLLAEFEI